MQLPEDIPFTQILLEILQLHPEGLSEYELLQRLRSDERMEFDRDRLDDPHDLFRTHFLLFHHLYGLRDTLHDNQTGDLEIHVLKIRWHTTCDHTTQALTQADPLRAYYLDLDNLEGISRTEVEQLLGSFWARFARYDRRAEALAALDLPPEADDATIRQQYRRLAMRHHPDRGGDQSRLQVINAAMAILAPRSQS